MLIFGIVCGTRGPNSRIRRGTPNAEDESSRSRRSTTMPNRKQRTAGVTALLDSDIDQMTSHASRSSSIRPIDPGRGILPQDLFLQRLCLERKVWSARTKILPSFCFIWLISRRDGKPRRNFERAGPDRKRGTKKKRIWRVGTKRIRSWGSYSMISAPMKMQRQSTTGCGTDFVKQSAPGGARKASRHINSSLHVLGGRSGGSGLE